MKRQTLLANTHFMMLTVFIMVECPINIVYEVPLMTWPTPTLNVNGFCPGSFVLGQIKKTDTQGYKMLCKDPLQNYTPGCPIEVAYM